MAAYLGKYLAAASGEDEGTDSGVCEIGVVNCVCAGGDVGVVVAGRDDVALGMVAWARVLSARRVVEKLIKLRDSSPFCNDSCPLAGPAGLSYWPWPQLMVRLASVTGPGLN
jgi:hypothetical protein